MMFSITTKFTRPNSNSKFFYEEFNDHPIVLEIRKQFFNFPGHIDITVVKDDLLTKEIAMTFDNVDTFWKFSQEHCDILDKRRQLVEEWCKKNNHCYSWTMQVNI